MEIIVDGVQYAPVADTVPSIGVGICTRNRRETAAATVKAWRERLPAGAKLVIVDDASDTPFPDADFRFSENVGVARAKNKCLELLDDCEHIFLADDDIRPLVDDWWRPYVECREPHLMWIFDKPVGATGRQVEILFEDDEIVAYHATRGCLLYVQHEVLDKVGGMDPGFGKWGWEHASWSDRIHAAGLTTARYMDVKDSGGLFESLDQLGKVQSTATSVARRYSEGPGKELRMQSRHSARYIEYRDLKDSVLTCLLTAQNDPQRGKRMDARPQMLEKLRASIASYGDGARFTVFHTTDGLSVKGAEMVQVKQDMNVYFERWLHYYRYLRDHKDIGRVWCVDGTDVQMMRNPFPEMEHGVLYMGYEPKTLRDEWMLAQHPDRTLQDWMKANPSLPIVNMGVVGGDRDIVMSFAQKVVKFYFDDWIDFIHGWETKRTGVGDMAVGNYIARTEFSDVLSSGPHVTSVFKAEERKTDAWWKHK